MNNTQCKAIGGYMNNTQFGWQENREFLWFGAVADPKNITNKLLSFANLSNANLSNADLRNADLGNANLRNANLSRADLGNANLRNANLSNADLSNADLRFANLSNANLRFADLSYADLDYSIINLSCKDLCHHIDDRLAIQRLYHLLKNVAYSKNVSAGLKKKLLTKTLKRLANEFHRADECGKLEDI